MTSPTHNSFLTLCVPCIVTNYVNEPTRWTFYIYLSYNFHIHSTCFEWSSRSSSGVDHSALYYTALYKRASVSSCFGLTFTQSQFFLLKKKQKFAQNTYNMNTVPPSPTCSGGKTLSSGSNTKFKTQKGELHKSNFLHSYDMKHISVLNVWLKYLITVLLIAVPR